MRRVGGLLLVVMLLCAGLPGAAVGAGAEVRPLSAGGLVFGTIYGLEDAEEYAFSVDLGEEQMLRQIDERTVGVFYPGHELAFSISAVPAHDAQGANVPTSLAASAPDTIVLTVHHRAGNPAAGGAPFAYPITGGTGWEGGFRTITVPMENPSPAPAAAQPAPTEATSPPAPEHVLVTRALGEDRLYFRPHSFLLSADGTFGVGKVQWSSYGGAVATATGRASVNDCIPNCAAGRFSHPQATLRLSKLTACQGKSVYARLGYALSGPLPKGFPRRGSFSMLPADESGKPEC